MNLNFVIFSPYTERTISLRNMVICALFSAKVRLVIASFLNLCKKLKEYEVFGYPITFVNVKN